MCIPSTFKRPVSSWKALNLRKTLLMASSVRLKQLNCSRLPCVYAQETLTFLLKQKKTCVKNYVYIFFNDTATTEIYTLSLHDALPICWRSARGRLRSRPRRSDRHEACLGERCQPDRKRTRPNSSHSQISHAVYCLKKITLTHKQTSVKTYTQKE